MIEDFILLQKISDLQLWLFPIVDKWPKFEKFSTSNEVRQCIDRMIRYAVKSRKSKDSRRWLHEIDVELHVLREKMRYACHRRYISQRRLLIVARSVEEIGRIVGGLMKSKVKG